MSWRDLAAGALAGGLGTLALDAVASLDGAEPDDARAPVAGTAGGADADARGAADGCDTLRALAGYATGLVFGAVYGALRGRRRRRAPSLVSGACLGAAVMAVTDASATLAGADDPTRWSRTDWLASAVPHAVYGIVTALAFDRLSSPSSQRLRSGPAA
jgi:hypothetical protein